MKNFAEINRASTGAKKKINFFEKLWEHGRTLRRVGLVLVMCLMAIPQMWASCGYYDNSGKKLQVCFSKDGSDWWANNGDSQASAGDIGTINKSLYLDWFLTYVWKDGSDISWTDFYYRIYKKGSTPPSFSTAFRGYWLDNIGGNNCKYGNNSDMAVNCFGSGVVPGATYVVEYYINTDCAGYLSNSSNNFKWEFTVPQRYLAADFTETTWSTTAYPLSDGSITIKDIAGNKTCNFCLTPNNTWDGKVYWNVGTGSTNPNGNVTLSDGGASDHNIRFTTPSGYRSDVTVSYDGNQVSVNCARRWTVTYHDDGKTSGSKPTDTNTYSNGTTVKVKDNTGLMVKTGKVFAGWATSSARATAGTVDYDPANSSNNTFSITQDMNLYPVWKNGCYLINGTTLNSSDFIVGTNGLQDNSYSVNGVTFSSKNFKFGSTKSSLKGQTYGAGTMLVYDTKKSNTKITIYAYNNNNSNKNLYYQVIKEGESVASDASFTVSNKSEGIYQLTINHSKGTRVVFCSNSGDLRICQMRVIEEGDPIKAVGEKGFQIALPGRSFSTVSSSSAPYADLIDGVSLKNNTNTQLGQTTTYWDVRGTSGSTSTQYISFTTTAATKLQVTTVNDDYNTFYLKKGSAALNTSTDATYSGKNTTININLSETGTWYILGTQAHIKKIAFDDFVAATAPTAFAATATTSSSVTLSITDGTNSKWEIYYSTSSTAPTAATPATVSNIASKTPTVTGLTAGTNYYMWVRSVADYFNKSSWVALTSNPVTTDTPSCEATAPGSISKGAASGGTGTITLTAAGSAATNNTWYWQSAADGTATNLGSGATKDVSATGNYYLRSYCSDYGGCWSDAVSVTVAAADLLTTPTATFSNSYYIIGGSSLDLSSLWTSDSEGSVTYSVPSAGGTGASISTAAFTATTAGTATVRASQAANGNYSAITRDATITVLPGYATSIDFEAIIDASESSSWKTTMEGRNYKLTQSNSSNWSMDDGKTGGTKQADKGLKIKETGDNAGKIAFAVHANQTVELKVGTLAGTASGKASFSINGGASYSDITGASTASTGDPVTYTYKGNADRVYVFKTKSSSWNILQHITIGYKVTYDKGTYGTGTVDPMYKTHGTGLTLSSSTFSRGGYDQDGWSTSDGGPKVYDLGGSYTSNAEVTLYPHWTVACTDAELAYTVTEVNKTFGDAAFTNTLTNANSAVQYSSTVPAVATVNATTGQVTIVGAGSTTIKATIADDATYCDEEVSYSLNVAKAPIGVTATAGTATSVTHNSATLPFTLSSTTGVASVTINVYKNSDDSNVATISGVTAATSGSASATGLSAETTYYFKVKPIGDANHNDGSESAKSATFTTEAAPTLTAISADVLYQAADMANITFTEEDQAFTDLSSNSLFMIYGATSPTNYAAKGKNENHSVTDDISTKNFTSALYILSNSNTTSTDDPTQGAIEIITPSTAGLLYLYLDANNSSLTLKKKGTNTSTSLSGATYKAMEVDANTHYFINGSTSGKRGLYGIQYVSTYAVTITPTNVTKETGDGIAIKGKAYTATFTAKGGYELPDDATVTIASSPATKGTEYTWSVTDGTATLTIAKAYVTGAISISVSGVELEEHTITYNPMGGSVDPTSETVSTATLPTPTHASGYTFLGWYTTAGVEVSGTYHPTGNITLYAKWSGSCVGGGGSPTTIVLTDFGKQFSTSGSRYGRAYVGNISGDVHIIESNDAENQKIGDKDSTAIRVDYGSYIKVLGPNATVADYTTDSTFSSVSRVEFRFKMFNAGSGGTTTTIDVYVGNSKVASAIEVTGEKADPFKAISPITISPAKNGAVRIVNTGSGSTNKNIYLDSIAITYSGGSSCYTVTYHGNGATSGYVNDPVQHTAGSDVTVMYNDPTTGFKRTGYEFNGWNTETDASGTHYDYWDIDHRTIEDIAADVDLYAEWRIVIDADNTDFAGKDAPTAYKDVKVTNGATLTITNATTMRDVTVTNGATLKIQKGTTVHDITVETGSTLNVSTNSGSAITLTANSLSLVGGWGTVGNETKYDMPRVYINPASKIERTDKTINFDINVDNRNYYPIALPFEVSMSDVTYKDDILAAAASERYGSIYAVKTYNGQNRADGAYPVWRLVSKSETLKPGHGYILCAVPALAWGHEKEIIRFPMKNVADEWLSNGELGHYTDGKSVEHIKDTVHVTAYKKEEGETAKSNIGWNLLGVPYMSCYTSNEIAASDDAALITGQLDINTGKYKDGDDNIYVSVPTYNFSEYVQENISDAVLLPGWCFFIQVEESGTLTFDKDGENLPIYAPKREKAMPTVKTGIILSGAGAKDKTTILVSDKYNAADYEINADLEKLFGEESFTLATYSLSGETRLAYNALSNADAANIIPIGYRAPADGEYTFSINPRYAENGAFEHVNLIDYETGIMTDLLMGSYTFSTERTQLDTRFALNVVPSQNTPTDIETVGGEGFDANAPRKVLINDKMYIIVDGKMYDATGKKLK